LQGSLPIPLRHGPTARDDQTQPPFLTHQARLRCRSFLLHHCHSLQSFFYRHVPFLSCRCRVPVLASPPAFSTYPWWTISITEAIAAPQFYRIWLHSLSPAQRPCPCFFRHINASGRQPIQLWLRRQVHLHCAGRQPLCRASRPRHFRVAQSA
jgi:hypothetical protein